MSGKGVVMAIDPGAHGGIAWLGKDGLRHVVNMPETPVDILEKIREIEDEAFPEHPVCYIENVGHGMPNQSSSATAKFARHCGLLDGFLLAEGIRIEKVLPQKWQRTLGIGSSRDYEKREWKNRLKAKAQELYPDKKVTLVNADALLILDYAIKNEP